RILQTIPIDAILAEYLGLGARRRIVFYDVPNLPPILQHQSFWLWPTSRLDSAAHVPVLPGFPQASCPASAFCPRTRDGPRHSAWLGKAHCPLSAVGPTGRQPDSSYALQPSAFGLLKGSS